jgi:hypothetical protein
MQKSGLASGSLPGVPNMFLKNAPRKHEGHNAVVACKLTSRTPISEAHGSQLEARRSAAAGAMLLMLRDFVTFDFPLVSMAFRGYAPPGGIPLRLPGRSGSPEYAPRKGTARGGSNTGRAQVREALRGFNLPQDYIYNASSPGSRKAPGSQMRR